MQKLPVGIQTFSEIRKEDYLYIDKTQIALDLIENNKYAFLSRPRRFGKSLFLDTLKNIFQANKAYFEELFIYDHYDWRISYPVIYISFAGGVLHSRTALDQRILDILQDNQQALNIQLEPNMDAARCFKNLIVATYKKYQQPVVVLIDEYDKPLLDNITELDIALQMQDGLRNIYSVLKDSDEYLRFAFLTGVSKFSKVSIFSGLNNITDISLDKRYGNICGYTHEDIKTSFKAHLQGVDLNKLKTWYNGYNFLADDVYNPFDILLFIKNDFLYKNYWFETGTPNFLLKLLKQGDYFIPQLENLVADESLLNSFDIESLRLESILFQSGYLTIGKQSIDEDDFILYDLKLPNKEVTQSLNKLFIRYLTNEHTYTLRQKSLLKSLRQADLESFKTELTALFAAIPYNNYVNNTIAHFEGYYASVLYVYLASLGIELIAEDVTNRGRIDLTLKLNKQIYIIEFKVGDEDALAQITARNYHQKYISDTRELYLVGINFDEIDKNISQFSWQKIS